MVLNAIKSKIFLLQPTEGTGNPGMSASHPSDIAWVAKVFDCSHLKILTPKKSFK